MSDVRPVSMRHPGPTSRRRIFIGDIQGCADELSRLLDAIPFDPSSDELHPVGDLVNRGPASAATLRLLRSVDAGGVLGNHDLHLLRVAAGLRAAGARDTFQDVLDASDRDDLLAWLSARPFVREWPDLILVHAGLHPRWWLGGEGPSVARHFEGATPLEPNGAAVFAVSVRYCAPDGTRPPSDWPPPDAPFRPWFEHLPSGATGWPTVVFGHWARLGLLRRAGFRGLDTGCVWGRELTAWIAEEDRWFHVAAARPYSQHDRA